MAPFFLASWANEIAVSQGSTTVSPGIHSAPWACFRSPGSLLYNSDKLISVQNETPAALHLCAMVGMICASKKKNYQLFFHVFLHFPDAVTKYVTVDFSALAAIFKIIYKLSKKAKKYI